MKKKLTYSGIIAASAVCVVTGFFFTGCGDATNGVTIEKLFDATQAKLKETKVVESKLDILMDVEAKTSGITSDMKMTGDYNLNTDYNSKVAYIDGTLKEELLGMSAVQSQQMYMEKNDKNYTAYKRDKNTSYFLAEDDGEWSDWTFTTMETADGIQDIMVSDNLFKEINKYADNLKLQDKTENINGVEYYVVKGKVTGEKLKEVLKDDNTDFNGIEFDLTFYFDKLSNVFHKLEIDLTKGLKTALEKELVGSDIIGTDGQITYKESKITFTHNKFSNDKTVSVPEDIKKSAKEGEDTLNIFSF